MHGRGLLSFSYSERSELVVVFMAATESARAVTGADRIGRWKIRLICRLYIRPAHGETPVIPGPARELLKMGHEPGLRLCPSGSFKFLSTAFLGRARIALTRGPLK